MSCKDKPPCVEHNKAETRNANIDPLCTSVFHDGDSSLSMRVTEKWIELINQMERSSTPNTYHKT